MPKNNRQNVRLSSMIPIRVLLEDQSVVEALVDNIGFGGVKLGMNVPILVGTFIRLAIAQQDITVTVMAQCVWVKRADSVTYDYYAGFAFLGVTTETYHKIREILFKLADNDKMDL
jgi:hypothetical protein